MTRVFADTSYWIALTNRHDPHHQAALSMSEQIVRCRVVTSEMVLTEFLNFFGEKGEFLRKAAVGMVDEILADPNVRIWPLADDLFDRALDLYRSRLDKGYSLTDCSTMVLMSDEGVTEVLSTDPHFEQHGLMILLK